MATRKNTAKKVAAKTPAAPPAAPANASESTAENAPKSASKTAAKSTASTAQKPLATGDVEQFPSHVFRADMGEGIPPQKDVLNPKRAE